VINIGRTRWNGVPGGISGLSLLRAMVLYSR
jgi:hypothetical protein